MATQPAAGGTGEGGLRAGPAEAAPGAILDLAAFEATPLSRDPYDTVIVPGFVRPAALPAVNADFPAIETPTTFMVEGLGYGPAFAALIEELRSDGFARRVSAKFGLDVTGLPRMVSVRRFAEPSDGAIHTDSKTKVLTVLVYLNTEWAQPGGRLRVLRGPRDMADFAREVVPVNGTMFAFRRSERSWHGFLPAAGERRSVQMQYVEAKRSERGVTHKHALGKRLRRLLRAFG